MTRRTSSCRIYSTTHHNGRRRGHREGERASTLTLIHSCHRTRIPGGHVLIEHRCGMKHCKTNPPHKQQQKRSRFKPQTTKQRTKRVRLVTRRTSRCRIYSTTHHHRERASTLTLIHPCHRPRIPVGHVLIEHRCVRKHCKNREGCNKEKRKTKPTTQTTTTEQKGPVSNHTNKKKERNV